MSDMTVTHTCTGAGSSRFRAAFAFLLVLFAGSGFAQVEVPPVPYGPPPGPHANICTALQLNNPNYDAWDPCCYTGPGRPAYCPKVPANPFKLVQPGVESFFEDLLIDLGLDHLTGRFTDNIARELAKEVFEQAWDLVDRLLNGGGSNGGGPMVISPSQLQALLPGRDHLTSMMLASTAAISRSIFFVVVEDESYPLPFRAGPNIAGACQRAGGLHKDRNFNLAKMGGTSVNGNLVFTTQAGVPTEIVANRPSWLSREIWNFRWVWWFGDASTVPFSSKDDASTVHTYSLKGDHALAFVMLKNEIEVLFMFGGPADFSDVNWRSPDFNSSDYYFPDACNYGTMRVVENSRPSAFVNVSPSGQPNQLRFDANSASDPDGNPLSYLWRFNDGATMRAKMFVKSYPASNSPITDTIQLTVSDGAKMHTTSRTFTVMPTNCPGSTRGCR